jgi:DNA-binding MarR family transcriptional regulator
MPDDVRLDAWRMLLTAHAATIATLSAEMEEAHGIPLGWYEVLLYLHDAPQRRLRMHELADSLLLSRSAATRFVDRMQEAGLVERDTDPSDRRGTLVAMTRDGRRVFSKAAPTHLAGIRRHFTDHLDTDEAEVIAGAMRKVLGIPGDVQGGGPR